MYKMFHINLQEFSRSTRRLTHLGSSNLDILRDLDILYESQGSFATQSGCIGLPKLDDVNP